jgi:plasmid stabilization system protein ParE
MRVRLTPRAYNDLASVLDYIDAQSPQGARNVKRAIQKTIELIGQMPQAGRRGGVAETRVLSAGRYPYLIYWAITAGEAWIVHIRHGARRPWRGE